jgi:hypothetical protein
MTTGQYRLTIQTGIALVAAFAVAMGLARLPLVWQVLDSRRSGNLVATLRYVWVWVGLALALFLVRSLAQRLVAYGWVLAGCLAIKSVSPHLDLGLLPDIPGYFDLATALAMIAFWLVGWGLGLVSSRYRPGAGASEDA